MFKVSNNSNLYPMQIRSVGPEYILHVKSVKGILE